MSKRRFRVEPRILAAGAALLLAGLAYASSRQYLAAQERAVEARVAERHQKTPVLVARADIAPGTVLTPEVLATRQIPARYLPGAAALPQDLDRVKGQRLLHAARGGEPILWPSLAGGERAALSAGLDAGRRALTFPVDEVNALSGMLVPGDVIDLLYTDSSGGARTSIRPLLQRVTVLATGATTRAASLGDATDSARDAGAHFATVTLSVTPEEAQLIVLAQRAGELTAVLRHPADASIEPARAVDVLALLGGKPPRPSGRARVEYVDVISGGSRGVASRARLPIDGLAAELTAAPSPAAVRPDTAPAERAGATPLPRDPGDIRTRLGLPASPST